MNTNSGDQIVSPTTQPTSDVPGLDNSGGILDTSNYSGDRVAAIGGNNGLGANAVFLAIAVVIAILVIVAII